MKLPLVFAGLASLFLSLPGVAQEGRDDIFLTARDAFRNGDRIRLDNAAARIGNHELAAYVENYQLRMRMDDGDSEALRAFLARQEGSSVAERLRADWIRWLGKRSQWSEVEREYPKLLAPEPEVTCLYQQARLARGDRSVLNEVDRLWQEMLDPPAACQPLLDALVYAQRVSPDDIWNRVRRQLEAGRTGPARTTLNYLPDSEMPEGRRYELTIAGPQRQLASLPARWQDQRASRELVAIAIQRLAVSDPRLAAGELEKRQSLLRQPEREWAWSQIAQQGARRHLPEALDWYARAGSIPLSDEGFQWKVRAALRKLDWSSVRDTIQAMPAELAARPEWIYWLGRAYKAGGRTAEADALFARIAGQANFYGNLADEELGRSVTPPPRARAPSAEELREAKDNPGLRRALVFLRLNMRIEGVREWNWSLRGMNDRQLLAAAELARHNQIWDRAINTAERTRDEHDYTLRFLAPYDEQVRAAARNQTLDDAWVYGLMRQESRFVTNAKSSAGASGLMQLMPATAKWVANKIGLRDYHHGRVNDTETNLLLGTSYMRLVMENLDNHPVLASAAYNAGPGRAKRWRPAEQPLEGAIYAETIPFSETRDYVKKVMSNAVYYSTLFNGKPDSLKARLGTIGPAGAQPMKDADLP
ncbi:transglycosylase SLT domain-containing protein [Azonexus sp.]|jgi:soluble lytic murein transglycosylase|uniref:lytic transglycosylase domain-containing protein n=1 Tax=Azonexus sp. TaxID=1872668 RepID=UPI00282FC774|nr:transglycosylase SLT domain-containing protein [Azonexus sp.]MDR1995509.1 lytic transglycosylase domain-containing protein [Azonexus sp.]